jgi:hypothetical protein
MAHIDSELQRLEEAVRVACKRRCGGTSHDLGPSGLRRSRRRCRRLSADRRRLVLRQTNRKVVTTSRIAATPVDR